MELEHTGQGYDRRLGGADRWRDGDQPAGLLSRIKGGSRTTARQPIHDLYQCDVRMLVGTAEASRGDTRNGVSDVVLSRRATVDRGGGFMAALSQQRRRQDCHRSQEARGYPPAGISDERAATRSA